MKNSNSALLVRVLCFGAAAACSTLIFRDVPLIRASVEELPREDVDHEVAWIHGSVSTQRVDLKTVIQTGETSGAKVGLRAGHALWLGQRTEARVSDQDVSLISGSVSVRRAPAGTAALPAISTGSVTAVSDDAAEFALRELHSGRYRLEVVTGVVTLKSPVGSMSVHGGEEASYSEGVRELARLGRTSFSLLAPRGSESISPEDGQVKFRWNVDVNASEGRALELQLSPDPGFSAIARSYVVPASEPPLKYVEISLNIPASLAPWYWRVRARGDTLFSHVEQFWLLPRLAPALRFPASGATVDAGRSVELIWNPVDNALAYEIEAGGQERKTADRWISVSNLPEGLSSWRVRAILPGGDRTPWSPARDLVVNAVTQDPDKR